MKRREGWREKREGEHLFINQFLRVRGRKECRVLIHLRLKKLRDSCPRDGLFSK